MRKTEPGDATSSDCMEIECLRVPSPELKISLYSSVNDPELLSAPRIPCDGQSRMMASRTVTSWASLNTQDSVPPLTSKPSTTTWLDCWNLMVCVPPRRTRRDEPTERFRRNLTGVPGGPRPSPPPMAYTVVAD